MININECFNVYVDIPRNQGMLYFNVQVFKNLTKILEYDTKDYDENKAYNFSIFDGKKWKSIPINGLIDSSVYYKIAIKHINDYVNNFNYKYTFLNSQDQIVDSNQLMVGAKSLDVNNNIYFRIYVPQLITTFNPILYWKKSIDLDMEDLHYTIELYQNNDLISTYQNITLQNQQYIQRKLEDVNLHLQTIYKWRVSAQDEFGQASDWSDFYCFKIIDVLNFRTIVQRKFSVDLQNFISVQVEKQLLNQKVVVKNIVNSDLYAFIDVSVDKQLLYFKVNCLSSNNFLLNFFVFVDISKQLLHFKTIVRRTFDRQMNQSVFVDISKQLLHFKIDLPILLKCRVQVVRRIETNADQDLKFKLSILTTCDIRNTIKVGRRFVRDIDSLYFNLNIIRKHYNPFQITIYDQYNNVVAIDNRVKIYNESHVRIIPLNEYQTVISVYPYIQNGENHQAVIYNQLGDVISTYYDIDGNQITVYDSKNKVKNWLQNKTYMAKYSYYNQSVYYRYSFNNTESNLLDFQTNNTSIVLPIEVSGIWNLRVTPYIDGIPLFEQIASQTIYTNVLPNCPSPPFFIDGLFINNETTIQNSIPVFSFTPVSNTDNDSIKYHLMIGQDPNFLNNNVNQYLNQENNVIEYQFKDEQRLQSQGLYYIYLSTCDYNGDQLKTEVQSQLLVFNYKYNYLMLRDQLQVVQKFWIALGYKLLVRGNLDLPDFNVVVYKVYEKSLNGLIHIYTQYVQRSADDLYHTLYVKRLQQSNLLFNLIVKKLQWDLDLRLNIKETYDYDLPFSIYVASGSTQKLTDEQQTSLGLQINYRIKTVYYETSDLIPFSVLVRQRFNNTNDLKGKCLVWNHLFPPYKFDIHYSIGVSNFVFASRLLMHRLSVYFPQPPIVIIRSNIAQKTWQRNYKAEYYLSLKEQSKLPFLYYEYIIDRYQSVKTWNGCKTTITTVKIDLRQAIADKETGMFYFHVRSVNIKNVRSSHVTTYCIYYNHSVNPPIPLTVNGNLVNGNQRPVVNYTSTIVLYWSEIIDEMDIGDQITYDLQISKYSNFNEIYYEQNKINGTFFTIMPRVLQPSLYYFRLRSFDQNEYSGWSIIAMFYVNKAPEAPTKLYVKNIS